MTALDDALTRIAVDLRDLGLPWALVGGLAVCARADPRSTADVDIAVAVADDATADGCIDGLVALGYRRRELILHDEVGRIATVRLLSPVTEEGVPVDLFFASSGVEAEVVAGAEPLEVANGLTVPVSGIGHLIAVKLCWRAGAKRDRDLRTLIDHANSDDLQVARRLTGMITERGYHRGRDLEGALDGWLGARRI